MSSVLGDMLDGTVTEPAATGKVVGFTVTCQSDRDGSLMWFDHDGQKHIYIGRSWADGRVQVHERDCKHGKEIAYRRSELERRTRIAILVGLFEVDDGAGSEAVPEGEGSSGQDDC